MLLTLSLFLAACLAPQTPPLPPMGEGLGVRVKAALRMRKFQTRATFCPLPPMGEGLGVRVKPACASYKLALQLL